MGYYFFSVAAHTHILCHRITFFIRRLILCHHITFFIRRLLTHSELFPPFNGQKKYKFSKVFWFQISERPKKIEIFQSVLVSNLRTAKKIEIFQSVLVSNLRTAKKNINFPKCFGFKSPNGQKKYKFSKVFWFQIS